MKILIHSLLLLFIAHFTQSQGMNRAIELFENNEFTPAKKIFKSINANAVNYDKAQFYLGRIAFDEEDFDDAQDYFEKAVEFDDNNSTYHYWFGNATGRIAQDANFFKQGILAPQIKNSYERAVKLDAKNIDARWGLVEYYTLAPGVMGGSWEKAEETAKAIYALDKIQGHNALATVYLRQEKFTLAEREYIKATKLDQRFVFTLGYFYQNQEWYDKAFKVFEEELKKNPDNKGALYQIGRTSALSGNRSDLGLNSLDEYLSQTPKDNDPSHSAALMRKAMIYEKIGQKSKAQTYYKQSLDQDPKMTLAKEGLERVNE